MQVLLKMNFFLSFLVKNAVQVLNTALNKSRYGYSSLSNSVHTSEWEVLCFMDCDASKKSSDLFGITLTLLSRHTAFDYFQQGRWVRANKTAVRLIGHLIKVLPMFIRCRVASKCCVKEREVKNARAPKWIKSLGMCRGRESAFHMLPSVESKSSSPIYPSVDLEEHGVLRHGLITALTRYSNLAICETLSACWTETASDCIAAWPSMAMVPQLTICTDSSWGLSRTRSQDTSDKIRLYPVAWIGMGWT